MNKTTSYIFVLIPFSIEGINRRQCKKVMYEEREFGFICAPCDLIIPSEPFQDGIDTENVLHEAPSERRS